MTNKCKRGSKGKVCRFRKKSAKLIPTKGMSLLTWIIGAIVEIIGFLFLFAKQQYTIGIILILVGFIVALSSRGIKK